MATGVIVLFFGGFIALVFWFSNADGRRAEKAPPPKSRSEAAVPQPTPNDGWESQRVENLTFFAPPGLEVETTEKETRLAANVEGLGLFITASSPMKADQRELKEFGEQLVRDFGEKHSLKVRLLYSETVKFLGGTAAMITAALGSAAEAKIYLIHIFERDDVFYIVGVNYDKGDDKSRAAVDRLLSSARYEKPTTEASPEPEDSPLPAGWKRYAVGGFPVASPISIETGEGPDAIASGNAGGLGLVVSVEPYAGSQDGEAAIAELKTALREEAAREKESGTKILKPPVIEGAYAKIDDRTYPAAILRMELEDNGALLTKQLVRIKAGASAYQMIIFHDETGRFPPEVVDDIIKYSCPLFAPESEHKRSAASTSPVLDLESWKKYTVKNLFLFSPIPLKDESIGGSGIRYLSGSNGEYVVSTIVAPRGRHTARSHAQDSIRFYSDKVDFSEVKIEDGTLAGLPGVNVVAKGKFKGNPCTAYLWVSADKEQIYEVAVLVGDRVKLGREIAHLILKNTGLTAPRSATTTPTKPTPNSQAVPQDWGKYEIENMVVRSPIPLWLGILFFDDSISGQDRKRGISISATAKNDRIEDLAAEARAKVERLRGGYGSITQNKTTETTVSGRPALHTHLRYRGSSGPVKGIHSLDFHTEDRRYNLTILVEDDDAEDGAKLARRIIDGVTLIDPVQALKAEEAADIDAASLPPAEKWPESQVKNLTLSAPIPLREVDTGETFLKAMVGSAKDFSINGHVYDGTKGFNIAEFNANHIRKIIKNDKVAIEHTDIIINGFPGVRSVAVMKSGQNSYTWEYATASDGKNLYQIIVVYDTSKPALAAMARRVVEKARIER